MKLLPLLWLALLCSCGGGGSDAALPSLNGTWVATSLPVGSALTIALTEQDDKIAGLGTYRREAGASGALTVGGIRTGAQVAMELLYDDGNKASYAAIMKDANHLSGVLAFQGGSSSAVDFMRQ